MKRMVSQPLKPLTLIEAFKRSDLRGKMGILLAGWFFAGLFPVAPGTFGTISAIPLVILVGVQPPPLKAISSLLLLAVAIWSVQVAQQIIGGEDPSQVVIDEVAGYLLTMLFFPLTWKGFLVGFLLFRAFDIFKPFPIRWLERKLPGAIGIVVDDLAAGLFGGILGRTLFPVLFQ